MQSLTALLVARGFIFSAQKNLLYTGLMGVGAQWIVKKANTNNTCTDVFKHRDK
jgi:hypothetical protein